MLPSTVKIFLDCSLLKGFANSGMALSTDGTNMGAVFWWETLGLTSIKSHDRTDEKL
jgi:hypothetical protein